MRRGSETRRHNRRRRRTRRLGFAAVLFVVLASGVAFFEYGSSSTSEGAERPQTPEPSQTEPPPPAAKPVQSTDEAWATAVAQDASPSLATQGENASFGHRVALTFDDGPDPTTTPAILDILRTYNVKATFFVIGARAQQNPELIKRIVSEGHTLGNHTYYHRDMTNLTPEQMTKELQDTQAVIDQALGGHSQITLFRPPCAAPYNTETERLPAFQEFMREQKMYPVMWNVDSRDWALGDQPDLIVDNIAQGTPADGGVILLHDTQPQTVSALPKILDYYASNNFGFASTRDLLAAKYGVEPDGIEPDPNSPSQSATTPQLNVPGNDAPDNLNSLGECLTY